MSRNNPSRRQEQKTISQTSKSGQKVEDIAKIEGKKSGSTTKKASEVN